MAWRESSRAVIHWYLIRATGLVTLGLLTLTVVLGLLNRSRVASYRWPRFVIDRLHRNVSLFTLVFLGLHIITAVTDSFVNIALLDAVIPFYHSYSPFWVGLGAIAFDSLIALVVTSLLRVRLGVTAWRRVHWLAYLAWPVAVAHGLGLGTDSGQLWMLAVELLCIISVLAALTIRVRAPADMLEWPS
jgi:methionine sulfoxide reductase heme-binding subunit